MAQEMPPKGHRSAVTSARRRCNYIDSFLPFRILQIHPVFQPTLHWLCPQTHSDQLLSPSGIKILVFSVQPPHQHRQTRKKHTFVLRRSYEQNTLEIVLYGADSSSLQAVGSSHHEAVKASCTEPAQVFDSALPDLSDTSSKNERPAAVTFRRLIN